MGIDRDFHKETYWLRSVVVTHMHHHPYWPVPGLGRVSGLVVLSAVKPKCQMSKIRKANSEVRVSTSTSIKKKSLLFLVSCLKLQFAEQQRNGGRKYDFRMGKDLVNTEGYGFRSRAKARSQGKTMNLLSLP